jgi:hypothetical protein
LSVEFNYRRIRTRAVFQGESNGVAMALSIRREVG